MTDYSFKSMTEQANAIQENLISPVKLLEEFFEKISAEKKSSQIFTEVYFNEALDEAKKSEFRQINIPDYKKSIDISEFAVERVLDKNARPEPYVL